MLAAVLLVPTAATLLTAWRSLHAGLHPEAIPLTLTALGALAINLFCAALLAQVRGHGGSLTRAAFLSARNDALANIAMIGAGLVTAWVWQSAWPDLVVGLAIAALNADAARQVWQAAHGDRLASADARP